MNPLLQAIADLAHSIGSVLAIACVASAVFSGYLPKDSWAYRFAVGAGCLFSASLLLTFLKLVA